MDPATTQPGQLGTRPDGQAREEIVPRTERLNATRIDQPAFLVNAPFSYAANEPNNIWMEELNHEQRQVDMRQALKQFLGIYHYLAHDSLVYVLPTPAAGALQDLVFTANLGLVVHHRDDRNTVILSNFSTAPRVGETAVGQRFFEAMGYEVVVSPHRFEGEADIKHLYDNVYIGGYGMRSEIEAYEWMEQSFDMQIIKVQETDPYLYHLDCSIFPITREDTLVCTEMFSPEEIRAMEEHTNIIDVSADEAFAGICNSVRLYNTILNSSHLHELKAGTEDYDLEVAKNRKLEDIAVNLGFEINYFNLSEYHKGGALLSCMVMHLNRNSYNFSLL